MSVLQVKGLSKQYGKNSLVLDGVSFTVCEGECLGIVGESGSGKSTLARLLLGLEPSFEGSITYKGLPIPPPKRSLQRQYRKNIQMIFQDTTSTLNPKLPIWKSVMEPLDNFKEITPSYLSSKSLSSKRLTRKEIAIRLLNMVGLHPQLAERYPDELSGGQRQRVNIARALSIEPSILVCDEPTTNLDVTVQNQILLLLKELQSQINMTILLISHDLRAVTFLCDRLIVLNKGKIVDQFHVEQIYDPNRHPYTQDLLKAASDE